jgi:hypothetical protein
MTPEYTSHGGCSGGLAGGGGAGGDVAPDREAPRRCPLARAAPRCFRDLCRFRELRDPTSWVLKDAGPGS